jgi:hypothetical protein
MVIPAINLTKDTLTPDVAKQIICGDCSYIYVVSLYPGENY